MKSRKAHMVGVVVVKWLILAHQHHPNTHHHVLLKNNTAHHNCVGFSIHGITTERRERVVVSEETAKTVIEE